MKRRSRSSVKSSVSADLAALSGLGREELVIRWEGLFGTLPPSNASQQLLLHGCAHRLQEKALGGLNAATGRFLAQVARGDSNGQKVAVPIVVKPGTRLLREWNGVTYEVTVLDDGVLFQGKKYRSLSEVARAITGVRWSGPLFFGIRKRVDQKGDTK